MARSVRPIGFQKTRNPPEALPYGAWGTGPPLGGFSIPPTFFSAPLVAPKAPMPREWRAFGAGATDGASDLRARGEENQIELAPSGATWEEITILGAASGQQSTGTI